MNNRSNLKTILYIFQVTALQQILLLSAFISVCIWCIWNNEDYTFNGPYLLLGSVGFLAMMFFALSVAVVYDSYTVPIFKRTHGEFEGPTFDNEDETAACYILTFADGRKAMADIRITKLGDFKLKLGL